MQRAKAFLFDLQAFHRRLEPNRGVDPFNLNIPEPGVNQPLRQHFGVAQAERARFLRLPFLPTSPDFAPEGQSASDVSATVGKPRRIFICLDSFFRSRGVRRARAIGSRIAFSAARWRRTWPANHVSN